MQKTCNVPEMEFTITDLEFTEKRPFLHFLLINKNRRRNEHLPALLLSIYAGSNIWQKNP